jgi:hypothetical protein
MKKKITSKALNKEHIQCLKEIVASLDYDIYHVENSQKHEYLEAALHVVNIIETLIKKLDKEK